MTEKHPDRLDEAMATDLVPPPPADLVDRTVQAMQAQAGAVRPQVERGSAGRARRLWPVAAALAAGIVLGAPIWTMLRARRDGFSAGQRQATAQETIEIGQRAVLVAEAGARLRWRPGPARAVQVDQPAGEVFYRVNSGPFVVHTPAGVVRVTGTCFRVEVSDMKLINRQNLSGAAVGAALGAAVVVTVYEGRVLLARDTGGGEMELRPGQSAQMTAVGVQRLSAGDPAPGARMTARPGVPRFDEAETLRTRIADQEKELAQLRASGAVAKKVEESKERFFNPSRQELLARADRCEIRWDTPNIQGVNEKDRVRLGLSETEATAMNEALNEVKEQAVRELRALYVELTGDATTAEKLAPQTIQSEIFARAPEGGRPQARRQLSRELAGLAPPPADVSKTPVIERTFRVMMSIGDRYERAVAERLGAQRARALREKDDGWRSKSVANGCE